MALTPSNMLALGTKAPDFNLPDTVSDKNISLQELKSDVATVLMFICNHCPYVIHVNDEIVNIANEYLPKGVKFAAISSNDVENYPVDSPDNMKAFAVDAGYKFPYLYDESQDIAKAYDAACTPDFYVFNGDLELVYRGRMDASSPGNGLENNGSELRKAIQDTIDGNALVEEQYPSMGCNIKWKA